MTGDYPKDTYYLQGNQCVGTAALGCPAERNAAVSNFQDARPDSRGGCPHPGGDSPLWSVIQGRLRRILPRNERNSKRAPVTVPGFRNRFPAPVAGKTRARG